MGRGQFLSQQPLGLPMRWQAKRAAAEGAQRPATLERNSGRPMKLSHTVIVSIAAVCSLFLPPGLSVAVEKGKEPPGSGAQVAPKPVRPIEVPKDVLDRQFPPQPSAKKYNRKSAAKKSPMRSMVERASPPKKSDVQGTKDGALPAGGRLPAQVLCCAVLAVRADVSMLDEVEPRVLDAKRRDIDRNHDGMVDPMELALGRMSMSVAGDIGLRGAELMVERFQQRAHVPRRGSAMPATAQESKGAAQTLGPRFVKQRPPRKRLSVIRPPAS